MADRPMGMRLGHYVEVVAYRERLEVLGDFCTVALVQKAAIPMAGLIDHPLVSIVEFLCPPPDEAVEFPPIASQLLSGGCHVAPVNGLCRGHFNIPFSIRQVSKSWSRSDPPQ